MHVPDNDDICSCFQRSRDKEESIHEDYETEINMLEVKLYDTSAMVKSDLDDAIEQLNDYDIENNSDLANRMEKVRDILVALYDKMEG